MKFSAHETNGIMLLVMAFFTLALGVYNHEAARPELTLVAVLITVVMAVSGILFLIERGWQRFWRLFPSRRRKGWPT